MLAMVKVKGMNEGRPRKQLYYFLDSKSLIFSFVINE